MRQPTLQFDKLNAADYNTVASMMKVWTGLESFFAVVSLLQAFALPLFVLFKEIPLRNQEYTLRYIFTSQNALLFSLLLCTSSYFALQAYEDATFDKKSLSLADLLEILVPIFPLLCEALFLYYSWFRSAVVAQLQVTKMTFRVYTYILLISPIIFLTPIVLAFLPHNFISHGTKLSILKICLPIGGTVCILIDLFFTFCFLRLEMQAADVKISTPAYYFVISRYGLIMTLISTITLVFFVTSYFLSVEAQKDPLFLKGIQVWRWYKICGICRDSLICSIPALLFLQKAALLKPGFLSGQLSTRSKLSGYFGTSTR
ncbi:hypothetical protein BCR33DRAFT_785392 [Rhizoclosmatium globosum]|uniref:Uncharacterized protein n=1 Tax=Rhizoclosmatium globosum TaxID=329046 RepID=A0A1Y2CCX7_9FUNG|nr:hypothetical protein BCR33DRAFT_785392 [Rhizoclosmatium globosum]|eukprot:ORY44165.1 hypothetical protein BCR33DRAFT_785392 [Rhizoclosmatium globosum]